VDQHRAHLLHPLGHRAGKPVQRGRGREDLAELVGVAVGDVGGVEVAAEPYRELVRRRERLLHRHLLVEHQPDQQRERVSREQPVGGIRLGENELGGLHVTSVPRYRHNAAVPLPIVLLHGQPTTHVSWLPVRRLLPGGDVYAPDRPGYGTNADPATDYPGNVEWLIRLLDGAAARRALIVGHSWAGGVALLAPAPPPGAVARR